MKLLFYDGFDKCSKCIYLLGIELLELIGKSIHSIGRLLTEIEKFLRSYVEVLTNNQPCVIEYLSSRLDALEGLGEMIDYNEISYTEIEDCIEDAKKGLLSPYWQGYAEREVDSLRLTDGSLPERAEQLYKELKTILHEVHQITDD